jgi:hypothetical protein
VEISRQVKSKQDVSIEKAISYMKNNYDLIIKNYMGGANHDYKNPRKFKELISGLGNCDISGDIYYFNGKAITENNIVIEYTN